MNITNNIKATADGIICIQERVRYLAAELKESSDRNLRQVCNYKNYFGFFECCLLNFFAIKQKIILSGFFFKK